jgi:peptidoglycan/LPS O-acetylase OafA/YrhL
VGVTGAAFGVVLVGMLVLDAKQAPGVWPVAGTVAAVFGITAMATLSAWPRFCRPMAALGRQTLPIYVIHMPALVLAHWALVGPLAAGPLAVRLGLAAVEPVLLTAVLVGVSLGLHALLLRLRAGWLFDLPRGKPAAAAAPVAVPAVEVTVPIPVVAVAACVESATAPLAAVRPLVDTLTVPLPRARARAAAVVRAW